MASPYAEVVTADSKAGRVVTRLEVNTQRLPGEAPDPQTEIYADGGADELAPLASERQRPAGRRTGKSSMEMGAELRSLRSSSERPSRAQHTVRKLTKSRTQTSFMEQSLDQVGGHKDPNQTFRLMSDQNMTALKLFQALDRDSSGCLDYVRHFSSIFGVFQ